MTRALLRYLEEKGEAASRDLVENALHIRGADDALCDRLIRTALGEDARCREKSKGLWALVPHAVGLPLRKATFAVVHPVWGEPASQAGELAALFLRIIKRGKPKSEMRLLSRMYRPEAGEFETDECTAASDEMMRRIARFVDVFPIVCFRAHSAVARLQRSAQAHGVAIENEPLCVSRLASALLGKAADASPEALASRFGLVHPESATAPEMLDLTADVFAQLLAMAKERKIDTVQALLDLQYSQSEEVDFSRFAFDREFIRTLPDGPGVYVMRDKDDKVLYVGKAKRLRVRVGSYFRPNTEEDEKMASLRARMFSLDYTPTGSELEALILEAQSIERLGPPVNVQLEVHERPVPYVRERRIVIVAPSLQAGSVELFALHGATALMQVRQRVRDMEKAADRLRRFFSRRPKKTHTGALVAASWLGRNRDAARYVDIDAAGGLAKAIPAIKKHAEDVLRGDPRMFYV